MAELDKEFIVLVAKEVAQQVAEQTAQAVSQAVSKLLQSQAQTTGQSILTAEKEIGETGFAERFQVASNDRSDLGWANVKRTYDEYQQESLESIKRNRSYVDKVLSDAATHDNRTRLIAEQALQNAVETANMVGKQAVRHGDIAIDRQWNVDEQGWTVESIINTIKPTLETVVAKILADMAVTKKE
jgi:hypothetical protein